MERLKWHIQANISPLLAGCRSSCTVEGVMQILSPPPPHLVELEVVTIKHLVTKMASSFAATTLQGATTTLQGATTTLQGATTTTTSSEHRPCADAEEEEEEEETVCDGGLPEAPVFLLGVLMSSVSPRAREGGRGMYTGLCLADATGRIPCEVG